MQGRGAGLDPVADMRSGDLGPRLGPRRPQRCRSRHVTAFRSPHPLARRRREPRPAAARFLRSVTSSSLQRGAPGRTLREHHRRSEDVPNTVRLRHMAPCRRDLRRTRWAPEELPRLLRRLGAAVEVPEPHHPVESHPGGARSVASGRTRGAMPMPDRPQGENRGGGTPGSHPEPTRSLCPLRPRTPTGSRPALSGG